MARRIYLASSWRNTQQPLWVDVLRNAGHEVYDFRHPKPGDDGFHWSEIDLAWQSWQPAHYIERLESHPLAESGFNSDFKAMARADTCVLLLPCGRSAHIEAGWMVGQGKATAIIVSADRFEPELMYLMADKRFAEDQAEDLFAWLRDLGQAEAA